MIYGWTPHRVKVRLRRLKGVDELIVEDLTDFTVLARSRYLMSSGFRMLIVVASFKPQNFGFDCCFGFQVSSAGVQCSGFQVESMSCAASRSNPCTFPTPCIFLQVPRLVFEVQGFIVQ